MDDRRKTRVLIVDDSAFARKVIREALGSDPGIEVVGVATDGIEALDRVRTLKPDVLTLDLEMPRMHGLEFLSQLLRTCPTPVVVFSSTTTEGAEVSLRCLEMGAVDVIAKPMVKGLPSLDELAGELALRVKAAAGVNMEKLLPVREPVLSQPSVPAAVRSTTPVVVIAASTGGPRALRSVLPALAVRSGAAFVVVQHLPVGFTRVLASDLNKVIGMPVWEAVDGDSLRPDAVMIAPSGVHLSVTRAGRAELRDDPPMWGVRPAADVTFAAVAAVFGKQTVGVVLTGMGRDGAHGLSLVKQHGGITIAESERTALIYGMPRAAFEADAVMHVCDLPDIPGQILRAVAQLRSAPGAD